MTPTNRDTDTPRTAAGRWLLSHHLGGGDPAGQDARSILAIEREAVEDYLRRDDGLLADLMAAGTAMRPSFSRAVRDAILARREAER